jgi:hypothetical protein
MRINCQHDVRAEVDHTHIFSQQSDKPGVICGSRCVPRRLHEATTEAYINYCAIAQVTRWWAEFTVGRHLHRV